MKHILASYQTKLIAMMLWIVLAGIAQAQSQLDQPQSDQGPIPIKLCLFILDIDDINSAEQNFTANVFLFATWKDETLANTNDKKIVCSLNEIWHPRLQFINQQKIWETMPEIAEILPDGTVTYRQRVWGQFSQPLNVRDFPFDEHRFSVRLVSTGFNTNEIEFINDADVPSGMASELSLADWKVISTNAMPDNYQLAPHRPFIPSYVLSFEAARESGYYVIKVLLPLILIVLMSWVVFWIDPSEGGTQIGVAMTAMLTLIAYRFAMGSNVPKIAYLTRMDHFILSSTILVFATLAEVLLTSQLAKKDRLKFAQWLDRVCRIIFPAAFVIIGYRARILQQFFYILKQYLFS